ncbi:hypothetical protein BpHYR1_022566 [Brachionus plicatilis]|uniref:Uncharacterized protein n=1 Tax=Brachionus plicatilis TaxID=10195 RepID=A0A3M7QFK9_BRAPC|nr:hypothetical protein BpHYR1_022566 [Brachionus plicatilis]
MTGKNALTVVENYAEIFVIFHLIHSCLKVTKKSPSPAGSKSVRSGIKTCQINFLITVAQNYNFDNLMSILNLPSNFDHLIMIMKFKLPEVT